jgi:Protein of unknown function (DUF935)
LDRPTFDEIASIADGRDITRPWIAPLLASQDEILETKGGGDLLVYEQLLTDTQIESGYQQRFSALIGCENEVIAGGTKRLDIKAADFIREQLAGINWDDITEKQLYATHYGYGVAECLWMRDGANVMLDDTRDGIRVRNRRRFKFAPDRSLRLIVWGDMFQGEQMPDRKFWTLRSGGDNHDEPYGRGLGHNLYWPVFFKRNDMKFWLRFLEKFSQPTVKVEYPSGMPKDQQDELLQSAYRMASASALKVPQGTVIDFLEAGRSGTADYVKLWELMDAAISKTILSQTMTTDSGSSLSQAQVHEGVASRLLKRDADLICASFNRSVIRWLVDWNYPGAAYPKVWRKIDPAADLKGMADRDKVLFDMGFKLTPEKVVETYGEGYYDPSQLKDESVDKPPLVSVLGVGGTTALVGFLQQIGQMGLKRENAIATLTAVFGIGANEAELMIPEDAIEEPGLDQLFGGNEAAVPAEEPPPVTEPAAAFSEAAKFAVLTVLDQAIEVDMIQYSETLSDAAIEQAIGRRLLALMSVEFAEKKCNPAKSHLCIGKTGKGSCVSLTKKCKVPVTGAAREASDYTAEKADIPDVEKETIAAKVDEKKVEAPTPVAPVATPEPAQPQSIDDRIKSGDLPKPLIKQNFEYADSDFVVEGTEKNSDVSIGGFFMRSGPKLRAYSVSFSIDGEFRRDDPQTDAEKAHNNRVGLHVLRKGKEWIKGLPDGLIVHNQPITSDGAGDGRIDVYKRFGFGPIDENGSQFAVVKGGKLVPLQSEGEAEQYFTSKSKKSRKRT